MKPVHIEFIRVHHWRWLWLLAVACVMGVSMVYARQYYQLTNERKSIEAQATELKKQLAPPPATAPQTTVDPRKASNLQIANTLQTDLNRVFTLIEAVKEPNTRLRNLSLEASGSTVRLEYEIDSMARASSVTLSLNAGYADGPWRLESVNLATPNTGNVVAGTPGVSQFRALWSANSSKL